MHVLLTEKNKLLPAWKVSDTCLNVTHPAETYIAYVQLNYYA